MKVLVAGLLFMLGAARAAADIYPIAPVDVVLRVEPDRVVADVDSDAVYWIEEVLGQDPLPPRGWSPGALSNAEKYVNAHLRLAADGKPYAGRLISATYRQSLGDVNEQGRVRLRLVYPALADGSTISGAADFFSEYRRELIAAKSSFVDLKGRPQVFETRLSVPGRALKEFSLGPGAMFSASVSDARRTKLQLVLQSAAAGAVALAAAWTAWPALAALALSLGPGLPSRARAAAGAVAAAAGAMLPLPAPAGLSWAAGALAALGAGRWLGEGAAPWLEAAALAALGRACGDGARAELPGSAPGIGARALAALGIAAAASAALAVGAALLGAEKRRLSVLSASRVDELFERRRRLAATALGIACLWGFFAGRNG